MSWADVCNIGLSTRNALRSGKLALLVLLLLVLLTALLSALSGLLLLLSGLVALTALLAALIALLILLVRAILIVVLLIHDGSLLGLGDSHPAMVNQNSRPIYFVAKQEPMRCVF